MRWYLDNQLYQTQTNWTSGTNSFPAPFDQRFHIILNLAVGGNWPGNPDTNTIFPQAMIVDYVRVYQKKK
jgi:beta-glucanase (GH16 family)